MFLEAIPAENTPGTPGRLPIAIPSETLYGNAS